MNNLFNCSDVVSMIIEEASSQFKPLWYIDHSKYEVLTKYCERLNLALREFDASSFEVEVDDITMSIYLRFECNEMVIDSKNNIFNELVANSVSITFKIKGEMIEVSLEFPSVWERI